MIKMAGKGRIDEVTCDLLIVRCEDVTVVKYAQKIVDCCACVEPKKVVIIKSLAKSDKQTVLTRKILFMVTSTSGDHQRNIERWLTLFPDFARAKKSVLIVHEVQESIDKFTYQFQDNHGQVIGWKIVNVKSLVDSFGWWPEVLEFIYDIKSYQVKPTRKTKVRAINVTPRDANAQKNVDQYCLKENLDTFVAKYHDKSDRSKLGIDTKKILVVAFGSNITIPFYAYERYRQTKINGGKVVFFFTSEVEYYPILKALSTHRFCPGQHMDGILVLMCCFASMEYLDPHPPAVKQPPGPLMVNKGGIFWIRLMQMGNRSLSLQRRDVLLNQWVEIESKLPLFKTSYVFTRSPSDATKEYRLVQEDDDGQMSEPLNFTETTGQLFERKALAFLVIILNIPNILLTLVFSPVTVTAFLVHRKRQGKLHVITSLDRNSKVAVVLFWIHSSLAFVLGSVGIILQHIFLSLHSVGFWFGLLIPFVLVCLNFLVRGQFVKFAKRNIVTCTVPGYYIPPTDLCYVFWTNSFFSDGGHKCAQRAVGVPREERAL